MYLLGYFWDTLLAQVATSTALPGVYRYFDAASVLFTSARQPEKARGQLHFNKQHGARALATWWARLRGWKPRWCAPNEALLLENNLVTQHPKVQHLVPR